MNYFSDVNFWRELITLGAFGLFIGISLWAYSKKRNSEFAEISDFVVQDDDTSGYEVRSK
jgi:cbb3-type cytochrome oxidase subunit 3